MEFFKTQKGKDACSFKGFGYRVEGVEECKIRWRCMSKGCKGKLWTDRNKNNPEERGEHSEDHQLGNAAEFRIKAVKSEMKDRARNESTEKIAKIYSDAASKMCTESEVAAVFPSFNSVSSTLYRSRGVNMPNLPKSLESIIIPEELQRTASGDLFLAHQSTNKDLLIFGTIKDIEKLSTNKKWYVDGTFNVAPPFFKQVFTIHAEKGDKVIPLVYCLMANKTQDMYAEVFRVLKVIAVSNGFQLSPSHIMLDFEAGLLSALTPEFPDTLLRGCYFHFSQAVYRKIQSLGLATVYHNNETVRAQCRQLMALAFLPVSLVISTFHSLKDSAPLILMPLFSYFQAQWIENTSIQLWNMYGVTKRTNNDVEGWHYRFKSMVGKNHPNIFKLVSCLLTEQSVSETVWAQVSAGTNVVRKNKTYVKIGKCIDALKDQFEMGEIKVEEYLKGIASNVSKPISF